MTGGMICPPDEAAASIPPAKVLWNPRFSIIGMVSTPVESTLTAPPYTTALREGEGLAATEAWAAEHSVGRWAGPFHGGLVLWLDEARR